MKYEELKKLLSVYMDQEHLKLIKEYYKLAQKIYQDMYRNTGEDYICHSIEVAYILAKLEMDPITIGCALIHEGITLEKVTYDEIKEKFGEETAIILNNISKISHLKRTFKKENNKEKYRRIIVGLAENPKVLFIKFADRLHNLKTVYIHDLEHQKEMLDETQNIYIPIAHRLGMKAIMSELEDLCLHYSEPEAYQDILDKINTSRQELEDCLELMKNEISEILYEHNIKFKILSRVKTVRGIYNKLKSGRKWGNIYDLLGIRILVNKIEECYLVLGYIHSKFKPIPKRFKDFIANPKSNMYQSVHTTVFGIEGKMYEVQVRTYEMDEIAEHGVASHWSYKEKSDGRVKNSLESRLDTFRALIDANDKGSNLEFFSNLTKELKKKEIYVFTPKGDAIELPTGATPIDFAYKIHSEVGNTTISALVNGKIEKLNYELEDGDIVSLNTQSGRGPSKNWLTFVKTDTAKGRIRSYFYKKEKEKFISIGKEMLELEAKKRKKNLNDLLNNYPLEKLLKELKADNLEDLYFSIYTLKYIPINILNKIDGTNEEKKEEQSNKSNYINKINAPLVLVSGSSDIMTSIASCCNPVFGEEIVGYVTKGYGIKVHSKNCKNINLNNKRLVEVKWNNEIENKFKAILNLYIDNSQDNLLEIITIANKYDINIDSMNFVRKNKFDAYYEIIIRVKNITLLDNFMSDLAKIHYINKLERVGN